MRVAMAAAAFVLSLGASAASACELPEIRQSGESRAAADERQRRDFQKSFWADSEVVFVGELSSIVRDRGVSVDVIPTASLKGEVKADRVTYPMDQSMLGCGLLSWPTMESPGVYFASRDPDGELRVKGMLTYEAIRDQALFNRLNEQIGLEPVPVEAREASLFPLMPSWAWLSVALGLSLLAGFWIGRASSKAPKSQKGRS